MKRILSLTAIMLFAYANAAHASTLDVILGPTLGYTTGASLSPDINLATYSGLTLNNNAEIVSPPNSISGVYTAPNGGVGLYGNNYLAVFGANSAPNFVNHNGFARLTLDPGEDLFGFTWGTVDPYNTLRLVTTNGVFTITGTEILNHIAGSQSGVSDEDVEFTDPGGTILRAIFTSSINSFEVANVEQGDAAPLPPALILFATALLGFAFLARTRLARRVVK